MTISRIPSVEGGIQPTLLTAKGDLISATAASTVARLAVGSDSQILVADSTASTGLKWATPSSGASFAGCSLYKSATQNISTSTGTILTFNTELLDVGGYHDTSTNTERITIPSGKAGYYLIQAKVDFLNNSTGQRTIWIRINGTTQIACSNQSIASVNENQTVLISQLYNCAVGDYFEVQVYQTSGTTLTAIAGQAATTFSINYLGA